MAVPPESLQIRARVTVHSDFYRQLGRRIAALRRSVGLSQERLGERARVGSSYIAHIELGSRKPTIDVLLRLADAVDVPLWKLLTDDRLTPDEKAWDAAARELGERVHGLAQPDLQALTYLATRLKTSESVAKAARPATLGDSPRSVSAVTTSRAAEPQQRWPPMSRRSRTKRSR
jgi:transcriptional regulator with XRE-family HTH domain